MAYDSSKDVELGSWSLDGKHNTLEVAVMQYNGGEAKVSLQRFFVKKNGDRQWTKLGRLTMDEYLWLIELKPEIQKAIREA